MNVIFPAIASFRCGLEKIDTSSLKFDKVFLANGAPFPAMKASEDFTKLTTTSSRSSVYRSYHALSVGDNQEDEKAAKVEKWTRVKRFSHAILVAGRGLIAALLPNCDVVDRLWQEPLEGRRHLLPQIVAALHSHVEYNTLGEEEKRVVVVIGGTQGIGKEIVFGFTQEACRIAMQFDELDYSRASKVFHEVEELGCEVALYNVDLKIQKDVNRMIRDTLDRWGKIDILVNAGSTTSGTSIDDVNLCGAMATTKAVLNTIGRNWKGSMINVAPRIGLDDSVEVVTYSKTIAASYPSMRVNTIIGGSVDSHEMGCDEVVADVVEKVRNIARTDSTGQVLVVGRSS